MQPQLRGFRCYDKSCLLSFKSNYGKMIIKENITKILKDISFVILSQSIIK